MPPKTAITPADFSLSFLTIFPMIRSMADNGMIELSGAIVLLNPDAEYVDLSTLPPVAFTEVFERLVLNWTHLEGHTGDSAQLDAAFRMAMASRAVDRSAGFQAGLFDSVSINGATTVVNALDTKLIIGVTGPPVPYSRVIAEAMAWTLVAVSH